MNKTIQLHRKFCHSKITDFLAIPLIARTDSLPTGSHSFLYTDVTHSEAILRVGSTGSLLKVTRILWLTYYIEIVRRFHAMLLHQDTSKLQELAISKFQLLVPYFLGFRASLPNTHLILQQVTRNFNVKVSEHSNYIWKWDLRIFSCTSFRLNSTHSWKVKDKSFSMFQLNIKVDSNVQSCWM